MDTFLARQMRDLLSRTRIKALIADGHVKLNGTACEHPNHRLQPGDRIVLDIPAPAPAAPPPQPISIDILFEDDSIIVINKQAGLVVHPAPGNPDGTLVNALIHHCGQSLKGIGGEMRPGIVHRLDRDTSGVLVVAKTQPAHNNLASQFADHGRTGVLERGYRAIAWGEFGKAAGTIDTALGRSPRNRLKRAVVAADRPDARRAVTRYRTVSRLDGNDDGMADAALLDCRLETGRTHQIRVHMAHVGHPLIGDTLYGAHMRTKARRLLEPARSIVESFPRQALHAAHLEFSHPETGRLMRFEVPLPQDMAILLASFKLLI